MAIAPVTVRGNYSHLFGSSALPVLEEIFRFELEQAPMLRNELFKVVPHDRDIYQSSEIAEMPLHSQMAEGEAYGFKSPKQGASKTFTVVKYGLGAAIAEEWIADNKMASVADIIRKMGVSARETMEVNALNIFNNGFTSETSADGQFVFDTDHTHPSGGTYRNELSTPADLSPTSLDQALSDFESVFVGDQGIVYRIRPRVLAVHSDNRRYAAELIGSELKPDSSDNNMNSLMGEGLRVASSSRFSDSDGWYLLAAPEETGLRVIERTGVETKGIGPDTGEGWVTDSILYKSRFREDVGVTHAFGIFGSPGA